LNALSSAANKSPLGTKKVPEGFWLFGAMALAAPDQGATRPGKQRIRLMVVRNPRKTRAMKTSSGWKPPQKTEKV